MTQIEFLQSGDIRLEVCPAAGGSITKFSIEGQDILRPAGKKLSEPRSRVDGRIPDGSLL